MKKAKISRKGWYALEQAIDMFTADFMADRNQPATPDRRSKRRGKKRSTRTSPSG